MRSRQLTVLLIVLVLAAQGIWSQSAVAEDPMTIWYSLSSEDRAEIEKTLSQRLPSLLGDDAGSYAETLATEIPRWWASAEHLERGDYGPMFDLYAEDLAGYVSNRFEQKLPEDSLALGVYLQAKRNRESLSRLMIAAADPNKSWGDVEAMLWSEVQQKLEAEARSRLEDAVRTVINEVTTDSEVIGYTAGDVYLLAVESWIDLIRRAGARVESSTANSLYRQYQGVRNERAGNRVPAEQHVRDLWVTGYVPAAGGGRALRSWNASLTRMHLTVSDFLPLFDRYWTQTQGKDDRFHQWLEERSRRAQRRRKNAASQALAAQHASAQDRLAQVHKLAAQEVRKAIEERLTDEQTAARDEALRQAKQLIAQMEDRNLAVTQEACDAFATALDKLTDVGGKVRFSQSQLSDLAEHVAAIKRISEFGELRAALKSRLAAVVSAMKSVDARLALAKQAARETCEAAAKVGTAASKDQGREHLEEALEKVSTVRAARLAAEGDKKAALGEVASFRAWMGDLDSLHRELIRDAHMRLHIIDEAIAILAERQQLEAEWNVRHANLAIAARRLEVIVGAFNAKARRIRDLLEPHHANARVIAVLDEVEKLRGRLACAEKHLRAWSPDGFTRLATRTFPRFEMPDPFALRDARQLLEAFTELAQLPDVGDVEIKIRYYEISLDEVGKQLDVAVDQADSCAARAIVDYDRSWLSGDLTRVVQDEANGGDADLSDLAGDVDWVPIEGEAETGEETADADLSDLAGEVTFVEPELEPEPEPEPESRVVTGRRPPPRAPDSSTTPPTVGEEIKPFYAVYKAYGAAPMPRFSGRDALIQMQRWFSQLDARTLKFPSVKGQISFLVTGNVLQDYADHVKRSDNNEVDKEYLLFRRGHCYHQIGELTTEDGHRLPYALLLTFSHVTRERPSSTVPLPLPSLSDVANRLQLADLDEPGRWSSADNRGNRLVMGPLAYSGEAQWSLDARSAAVGFMKQFGLAFLNQ